MKIIKIIILLVTIPLLSSITFNTANARDCSDPKGFHAKMMCKLGNFGSSSGTTEIKEAKGDGNASWIKKFLGKKNNEVTGRQKNKQRDKI